MSFPCMWLFPKCKQCVIPLFSVTASEACIVCSEIIFLHNLNISTYSYLMNWHCHSSLGVPKWHNRTWSLYVQTNGFRLREKRSYRPPHITVPSDAIVTYTDFSVRVARGRVWLYKFRNIRVFQVFNRAEGYMTSYRSGPEGRQFPGFGRQIYSSYWPTNDWTFILVLMVQPKPSTMGILHIWIRCLAL